MVEHFNLIERRLILVTGKGGTGKTTCASAIANLLAQRGKRVLLCEVDCTRSSLSEVYGKDVGSTATPMSTHLWTCNIRWDVALKDYLEEIIPLKKVAGRILNNRVIARLLNVIPGSREMVTLSRLVAYTETFDHVVVDMPASGHAYGLLDITRSALGMFKSCPIRHRAEQVIEVCSSPKTQLVFVALPEEMVVNETIETHQKMTTNNMIFQTPAIILNRSMEEDISLDARHTIRELSALSLTPVQLEFVDAGMRRVQEREATDQAVKRLKEAFKTPVLTVSDQGPGLTSAQSTQRIASELLGICS